MLLLFTDWGTRICGGVSACAFTSVRKLRGCLSDLLLKLLLELFCGRVSFSLLVAPLRRRIVSLGACVLWTSASRQECWLAER